MGFLCLWLTTGQGGKRHNSRIIRFSSSAINANLRETIPPRDRNGATGSVSMRVAINLIVRLLAAPKAEPAALWLYPANPMGWTRQ